MALTPIEIVRLYIGATATSPFYAVLSDEEIQYFIDNTDTLYEAAKYAAGAMYAQLVATPTREKTGEIEVWNEIFSGYLSFLNLFIKTPTVQSLKGLVPYAAGISWADIANNISNPDTVNPKLSVISVEEVYDVCEHNCQIE